jgi:oligogalacturonide lyase
MGGSRGPASGWTRRAVLSGLAGAGLTSASAAPERIASEAYAYADPATESPVLRLTSPSVKSCLPSTTARSLPRNRSFLLYSSERTGKPQAFRMSLRTGESELLTEAEQLDGTSLSLTPDERSLCYIDGSALWSMTLSNLRRRAVYRIADAWEFNPGICLSSDGRTAVFFERKGSSFRLRLLDISRGDARTLLESDVPHGDPLPRPRMPQILCRKGESDLWLIGSSGRDYRQLKLAPGRVGPVYWSTDGRSILYLSFPEEKRKLNAIREHVPDSGEDSLVAETSQFATFSPDGDASVFVGASANRASPHLLLLLRSSRRELTLCEHRASNPASVSPVFSPDSQQVFFQSDLHGQMAIYTMRVDRLVEKTDT